MAGPTSVESRVLKVLETHPGLTAKVTCPQEWYHKLS